MGLDIPKESFPITPIRTNHPPRTSCPVPSSSASNVPLDSDQIEASRDASDLDVYSDDECRTPTSEDHLLKTPIVCPPAPKKPRQRMSPPRRRSSLGITTVAEQESFLAQLEQQSDDHHHRRRPSLSKTSLEIPPEFQYPITPVRTSPHEHRHQRDERVRGSSGGGDQAVVPRDASSPVFDDDECRTPTSEDQLLKTPLVCPPAPKRPRREFTSKSPSRRQSFLGIPSDVDLSSLFILVRRSRKSRPVVDS